MQSVSIIIPVLNQLERLSCVLDALAQQSYQGEMEVIVVDNGSTDGTYELAQKRADLAIQEVSYQTPYVCRNRGMQVASHDVFILLDANCIPLGDFIESMLSCLGGKEKILGAKILPENMNQADAFQRFDFIFWSSLFQPL